MSNIPRLNSVVRACDLFKYTGLRRTQISLLVARGEFPAPIQLADGGRAKAWLETELIAWQAARLAKRDAHAKEVA